LRPVPSGLHRRSGGRSWRGGTGAAYGCDLSEAVLQSTLPTLRNELCPAVLPAPRLSDVVAFGRLLVEAGLMALIPLAAAALVLLAWA
jgi:hypothetical protein